jgi:hypothetical protein
MLAEFFYPNAESTIPLIAIALRRVPPVKAKFQLIIPVIFETENAGEVQIEFLKMKILCGGMLCDLISSGVSQTERIVPKEVFHFYIVNQMLKEVRLTGQLYLFKNIVFVAREKLSKHRDFEFHKSSKKPFTYFSKALLRSRLWHIFLKLFSTRVFKRHLIPLGYVAVYECAYGY